MMPPLGEDQGSSGVGIAKVDGRRGGLGGRFGGFGGQLGSLPSSIALEPRHPALPSGALSGEEKSKSDLNKALF